jgi:hypothetical protein
MRFRGSDWKVSGSSSCVSCPGFCLSTKGVRQCRVLAALISSEVVRARNSTVNFALRSRFAWTARPASTTTTASGTTLLSLVAAVWVSRGGSSSELWFFALIGVLLGVLRCERSSVRSWLLLLRTQHGIDQVQLERRVYVHHYIRATTAWLLSAVFSRSLAWLSLLVLADVGTADTFSFQPQTGQERFRFACEGSESWLRDSLKPRASRRVLLLTRRFL